MIQLVRTINVFQLARVASVKHVQFQLKQTVLRGMAHSKVMIQLAMMNPVQLFEVPVVHWAFALLKHQKKHVLYWMVHFMEKVVVVTMNRVQFREHVVWEQYVRMLTMKHAHSLAAFFKVLILIVNSSHAAYLVHVVWMTSVLSLLQVSAQSLKTHYTLMMDQLVRAIRVQQHRLVHVVPPMIHVRFLPEATVLMPRGHTKAMTRPVIQIHA
jgi:hypothetical protein